MFPFHCNYKHDISLNVLPGPQATMPSDFFFAMGEDMVMSIPCSALLKHSLGMWAWKGQNKEKCFFCENLYDLFILTLLLYEPAWFLVELKPISNFSMLSKQIAHSCS